MNNENGESKPDYAAWKDGIREVKSLSSPRFYFTITVAALVVIAYFMIRFDAHWSAGLFIAVLILLFGATVFIVQWRRDGYGDATKIRTAESSDQPPGTTTIDEAEGVVGCSQHSRSDSASAGSVRTPLGSETGESPNHSAKPK